MVAHTWAGQQGQGLRLLHTTSAGVPVAPQGCRGPSVSFAQLLLGFPQPGVCTMGAEPGSCCTWPTGGASGWHFRTRGHPMVCWPCGEGLQDSGWSCGMVGGQLLCNFAQWVTSNNNNYVQRRKKCGLQREDRMCRFPGLTLRYRGRVLTFVFKPPSVLISWTSIVIGQSLCSKFPLCPLQMFLTRGNRKTRSLKFKEQGQLGNTVMR